MKKNKNSVLQLRILRVSALIIMLSFLMPSVFYVSAQSAYTDVPYQSYTYQTGYNTKKTISIKPVYEAVSNLTGEKVGVGAFTNVNYVFSTDDSIYILDSGNSRIIVLDKNYDLTYIISSLDFNNESIDFTGARGLYVNKEKMVYIADTDHSRVLAVDSDKKVIDVIETPDSDLLDEDFLFSPARIVEDDNNYLYVLSDGCYYGALIFSPEREFVGFYGANTVKSTVFTVIDNVVQSLFDSEAKRNSSVKKLPFQFADICVDQKSFIYTVSESTVRRLGPSGNNILNYQDNYSFSSAENLVFGDDLKVYNSSNKAVQQSFSAVSVKGNYIYICDSLSGRIYMYDNACNLISVFAGGMGEGNQLGTFVTPSSITNFGKDLLVADQVKNTVTVFRLTDYGNTLITANNLTLSGDYSESKEYWQEIYKKDKNCQLALSGLAKAALVEEDYDLALDYAKRGVDRITYSKAFSKSMSRWVTDNFLLVFGGALFLVVAICVLIIYSNKHSVTLIKNRSVVLGLTTPIHPFASLGEIKYKKLTNIPLATVLLILFYIGKVSESLNGGFMYTMDNNETFNSLLLIIGTVGLVLLGTMVNWGVCILFEGKGKMKEIYCAFCYCLIPQIIYSLMFVILSQFIVPSGTTFITILNVVCIIYTVILLLCAVCVIHEFDFFKAMSTGIATILGMVLIGFVIFMVLTLCQNFVGFIVGIIREVTLR